MLRGARDLLPGRVGVAGGGMQVGQVFGGGTGCWDRVRVLPLGAEVCGCFVKVVEELELFGSSSDRGGVGCG